MAGFFRIRQLESPMRVLTLRSPAMPMKGWRVELEQRGENRWQAGSQEAEPLLSGIELPPTDFEFLWKKQTLGAGAEIDGSQIETVEVLVDTVRSMLQDAVLVTIEWERFAQVGWLRAVGYPIERPGEYRVDMTVEWVRIDENQRQRRPRPAADFGTMISSLTSRWSTALRRIRQPLAMAREAAAEAEDGILQINRSLLEMDAARGQYRDGAATSISVSGKMAESMGAIVGIGASLRTTAGRLPHDVMPLDEPANRIILQSYSASLQRAAARARHEAARARRRLLSEARPDVLRRHTAMADEDLRLLAWRTYGRVDAWQDVARFNELSGSTLRAGQSILLPRIEAGGIA